MSTKRLLSIATAVAALPAAGFAQSGNTPAAGMTTFRFAGPSPNETVSPEKKTSLASDGVCQFAVTCVSQLPSTAPVQFRLTDPIEVTLTTYFVGSVVVSTDIAARTCGTSVGATV